MNLSDVNISNSIYNSNAAQIQGTKDSSRPGNVKQAASGSLQNIGQAVTAGADAAIERALDEAGIPRNERNIDIARQMLGQRMPLDANSLKRIISQANMFREVELSTILLMNQNEIPVNRFTATQLQAYLNNEQNLSSQLAEVTDSVMEMLLQEAAENGTELNMAVLQLVSGGENDVIQQNTAIYDGSLQNIDINPNMLKDGNGAFEVKDGSAIPGMLQATENAGEASQILSGAAVSGENLESAVMNLVSHPENNINIGAQGVAAAGLSGSNTVASEAVSQGIAAGATGVVFAAMNDVENDVDGSGTDVFNGFASDSGSAMGENQLDTGEAGKGIGKGNLSQEGVSVPKDILILSSIFDDNEMTEFESLLRGFAMDTEGIGEKPIENALAELREGISNASDEELEKLVSASSYQKLIKNALSEKLSLNINELKDSDSLNNYYRNTFSTLSKLHELAEENEKVSNALEKPMDNVRFMDTLNNVFPYIQLPLKFNERNSHGELYIFKNGRTKSNPGEVQSVLLHLDMENLGSTDIHMELKSRSLNMHFYANDDISLRALSDNFDELREALEAKGFIISSKFSVRTEEETTSAMAEALAIESNAGPAFSYSFDIKA